MLTLESSHVVGLPAQLYTVQEVKEIIFSNDNYGVTSYKLRKKRTKLHVSTFLPQSAPGITRLRKKMV